MSYQSNDDNIYKVDSIITAKSAPDKPLLIIKYVHRTYYCAAVGDATAKPLTYFEKELLSPAAALKFK